MRKIILVIIMTITFSTAFGQYLKLENFQAESLPSTWTLSQQSTATWNIAHSRVLDSNAAHVSPSSTTQNEKLTSPQVDLYNANSPVLRFKYIATKNTDFSILVSYNEGMHSKEIWNSKNVSNLDSTKVNDEEISLEGYLGEYINIVLLYKGGDEVYIDDISVSEPEYEDINDRYCYFNTIPKTEPITFVGLNEIQNRRTNEAGQKSVYYFLDQKANVAKDQSYPIYLEGDTNGNKVNSFTIFIDWDQDGYFTSENEVYFVGTYSNSTGSDGTQLVGNINVPNNAKLGETRIRIVKLASDNSSFYACGSGNYNGQVQDYTLVVNDFEFCSPTLTSVSPITSVKIKNFENSSTSSSESVENFKNLSINLEQSGSEILEIKGNTSGNNTYSVTAFFDWNKDGLFSTDEIFQVGQITNSTGNDNISVKKQINIPQNAKLGKTTARIVMTKGNDYITDICNLSTDGQIEDYTVEILTGSCIKATTNEGIENGHANISKSTIANDFKIEPNHSFNLSQVKFDLLVQSDVTAANLTVYEDNNGTPGQAIWSESDIIPSNVEDTNYSLGGYELVRYTFNLKENLDLIAEDESKTYWIGINVNSAKNSALSATSNLNSEYSGRLSQDGGATWLELPGSGEWDGVLTLISSCGLLGTNDEIKTSSKTIEYYPNPVKDILYFNHDKNIGNIEVYDLVGKRIYSTTINSKSGSINLSNLTKGVYIIKTDVETFKVIKK